MAAGAAAERCDGSVFEAGSDEREDGRRIAGHGERGRLLDRRIVLGGIEPGNRGAADQQGERRRVRAGDVDRAVGEVGARPFVARRHVHRDVGQCAVLEQFLPRPIGRPNQRSPGPPPDRTSVSTEGWFVVVEEGQLIGAVRRAVRVVRICVQE